MSTILIGSQPTVQKIQLTLNRNLKSCWNKIIENCNLERMETNEPLQFEFIFIFNYVRELRRT